MKREHRLGNPNSGRPFQRGNGNIDSGARFENPVLRSSIPEYQVKTTNLELLVSPFDRTTGSFPSEVEHYYRSFGSPIYDR